MPKKGERYVCEACGIEVACTKECGCGVTNLVCCSEPMKKKTHKKPKSIKKK